MGGSVELNRRQFLGMAGAALGAAAVARKSIASTEANSRLRVATIGVGGQGSGHASRLSSGKDTELVAVCDVWTVRRDAWVRRTGCDGYLDYRYILDRKDVDAVTIGTPDHWHAQMSIDALEAGKHVYCEKPMTLTWDEAKRVAEVARRTGLVYQCGAQSASGGQWWRANQLINQGVIGKVIWSQAGYCRNNPGGDWNYPIDSSANPSNLDWDMWLGPAPKRPWSPERYFRFRKFWDYSGGLATDLLYHALTHIEVALGYEFPLEVSAVGGNYVHMEREVPDTFHVLIKYPTNHTVFLASTQENQDTPPDVIRGQLGTMYFEQGGIVVHPQASSEDRVAQGALSAGRPNLRDGKPHGVFFDPLPGQDHMQNWLDCIRNGRQPTLNADAAYKVMVAIHLSVLSYREGKTKRFDPLRQEVVA